MTQSSKQHPRIENALFDRVLSSAPAIRDESRLLTYSELAVLVDGFARRLVEAGVRPGDRVALFANKSPELVAALYAVWVAGAVAVPVHPALRSRQVEHIVLDSGARALVTTQSAMASLETRVVECVTIVDLEEKAEALAVCPRNLRGGSVLAAILYTSGSTGRPKGIAISHQNLVAGARIVSGYLDVRESDRILSVLPFSFDYGLSQLLIAVERGASLVVQRSLLPADICRSLEDHEITMLAAVPPLWLQLMQRFSPFSRMELPSLRAITNSGGAFPVELSRRMREQLPHVSIFLMYGLSEAFRSTFLDPALVDTRPESIGRAMPETEIHVLDDEGRECAPGETGELVHVGPTVALGYWNDPETTAEVFRPHPFEENRRAVFSGDLVQRDADGLLTFVGRRDQMIKSLGFRVSPDEIEEVLYDSGLVAEVCVRSHPDEMSGAAICAHVVPRDPQTFSEKALLDWCRREMPRYMVPKEIHAHESLPRTTSGKIDRKAIA